MLFMCLFCHCKDKICKIRTDAKRYNPTLKRYKMHNRIVKMWHEIGKNRQSWSNCYYKNGEKVLPLCSYSKTLNLPCLDCS